jgi:hypothetical protein
MDISYYQNIKLHCIECEKCFLCGRGVGRIIGGTRLINDYIYKDKCKYCEEKSQCEKCVQLILSFIEKIFEIFNNYHNNDERRDILKLIFSVKQLDYRFYTIKFLINNLNQLFEIMLYMLNNKPELFYEDHDCSGYTCDMHREMFTKCLNSNKFYERNCLMCNRSIGYENLILCNKYNEEKILDEYIYMFGKHFYTEEYFGNKIVIDKSDEFDITKFIFNYATQKFRNIIANLYNYTDKIPIVPQVVLIQDKLTEDDIVDTDIFLL